MSPWREQFHRFDVPGRTRAEIRHHAWLAELCVCRRYGLPERPHAVMDHADAGWDLLLGPLPVDVKWAPYDGDPLRVNTTTMRALVYVLVTGMEEEPREKAIRGFAWRRAVLHAPIRDGYAGSRYHRVIQSDLHPSLDLLAAAQGILPV